jgi:hypothetical protein
VNTLSEKWLFLGRVAFKKYLKKNQGIKTKQQQQKKNQPLQTAGSGNLEPEDV